MSDTIRELAERTSTRTFTDEPVTPEEERVIIEAAHQAPTAGNQQLYSIVVVRDQALKERLSHLCDEQPFIARAPLVLVFLADVRRWRDAFAAAGANPRMPGPGDFVLAAEDAAIAAQNAVAAAQSIGVGSCYIGDVMEHYEVMRDLLDLPEFVLPAVMLVFGHPDAHALARPKPARFAYDDIVSDDRYRRLEGDDLTRALAPKCTDRRGHEAWIRAFCERKWNADYAIELSRSVGAMLDTLTVPVVPKARPGVFITLEGADGCGKSTKARMLVADLEERGREVIHMRDPGGTDISEKIRELLLDTGNGAMSAECELLLYEAARAQLVREVIVPALDRGAVVVCDRFFDSTLAYQSHARGIDEGLVRNANRIGCCGVVPDRTIVFDLEPEESFERATRHGIDRMEAEGISFQERVREGYLAIAAAEPERVRVVNGSGEKAEVYERILEQLIDLFPELGGADA